MIHRHQKSSRIEIRQLELLQQPQIYVEMVYPW